MSEQQGHIELERTVDSIVIGARHREYGDLHPLMKSIERFGLLQPVTITPEGVLLCGSRRLEASKRLGWSILKVWVRTGISDDLSRLMAQQDENALHKPLEPMEAAALFTEMKTLLEEDAARRQRQTQFGAESGESAGRAGDAESASPQAGAGAVRRQAAMMITGKASHTRLEQICEMERIAADKTNPSTLRNVAEDELNAIRNGGAVDPSYQRVRAIARALAAQIPTDNSELERLADQTLKRARAERLEHIRENRARRAAAAATAKRSVRSFALMWAELDGWSKHYDSGVIARELKGDDWALFLRVLDETKAFAESVALAREQPDT